VKSEKLTDRKCVACERGIPPLVSEEVMTLSHQLSGWSVIEGKKLEKTWKFHDFLSALAFVNRVGELSEKEGHHPDIFLGWGKVKLTLWTHVIHGLSENDFILAAKVDHLDK
jgi:4a-hydroxytetrahydrobiopterin dehydratase